MSASCSPSRSAPLSPERTLLVSDLHLGSGAGADLLRRAEIRRTLIEALDGIDRLVLLGDTLELRHGPPREALAAARGLFEDLAEAFAGREIVLVPGNHDHALIEPWLARRAEEERGEPLAPEQLLEPWQASPMAERVAALAAPAVLRVAYPGLWVRPDVYATHGHFLDCHLTVPTIERLSLGVMSRLLGRPARAFSSVDDYEAVCAPAFAWRDAVSRSARPGAAVSGIATADAWKALGGPDHDGAGGAPAAFGGQGGRSHPGSGTGRRAPGAAARARALRTLRAPAPSSEAFPSPSPFSTAPVSASCAPTSRPPSFAGRGFRRWPRWLGGSASTPAM